MSLYVLDVDPSRTDKDAQYDRQQAALDSKSGPIATLDRADVPMPAWNPFVWIAETRAAAAELISFLDARAGRCVPFFVPTWQRDLILSETAGAMDTEIVIQAIGYTNFMFPSPARRWLAFLFPDGTKLYRQVTNAEASGDTETLTLALALGVELTSDVMISFLLCARLADDDIEIVWHTHEVAEARLRFVELPKLVETPDI